MIERQKEDVRVAGWVSKMLRVLRAECKESGNNIPTNNLRIVESPETIILWHHHIKQPRTEKHWLSAATRGG